LSNMSVTMFLSQTSKFAWCYWISF
jgi:hypothetical protein